MPSNNSKYSQEMREQTARHILETGKSPTSMAEELGIGVDTVCRWVRDYPEKARDAELCGKPCAAAGGRRRSGETGGSGRNGKTSWR